MTLNEAVKKNWIEVQKKHNVPVNAIGVKIDPKDEKTLKVWKERGDRPICEEVVAKRKLWRKREGLAARHRPHGPYFIEELKMVSEQDIRALLRDGIDIAKAGDKKLAHALLAKATRLDPQNEKAWIWRAGVAHDCAEAADCLQHVLSLNPQNQTAIEGLARLGINNSVAESTIAGGNGSKPHPPEYHEAETVRSQSLAYHEAETVRSQSTEIRSAIASAVDLQPTNSDLHTPEGSLELDVQLDQIEPVPVEQIEEIHMVTEQIDESASMPESDESSRILRVLIVDDSPTIRKLVSMTLGKHGYEVVSAGDGMEALARINDGAPDLILLDITMPRMDGYQLCRTIKGNDSTNHIPIVMLTGRDGFMDKVRGRVVGSEGYLTKPFNPDELVRMVSQHVGPA